MALPPPKPPRMLSNNQAAPELASLRETASEAALPSEAVVSISARDVAYDGTPLPPRNGKSSAAGQVKLTSNDDDRSEAVAPLRRESRAPSYVSLAPSSASDGVYAELTPLHRDSGLASVANPDLASSSGNTREVVVKAAPASSIAGDSPFAVNTGVYSAREDCDTGRRDSVNSAERSVFDIRDRRTFSEDSLALSAISNSTVRSFSGEGGDALFVPAMPDAAMDARGGDDMARQPDADKGEDVPATPLAASLPEIDARRTVASRADDKTGATHYHHRGEPSPLEDGNDNHFQSLTDGGNAPECPGRASDSGYLNLVNENNDGVLCHPVSDGRDSGYLSPADGNNIGDLPRLDEGASSNPIPEANTSDNLSGEVMENVTEGGIADGLPAGLTSFAPPTVIVPAVGVYAANHALANTLFISRRSERNGAAGMTVGSLAMNADPRPTLWLRILGGETHAFVGNGSLQTRTKRQVVQGGGTMLQFSRSGQDSGHVGVMLGAGKSMTLSRSTRVSSHASGGLQGDSRFPVFRSRRRCGNAPSARWYAGRRC
ncbi:autotransporter outer membrane beta-barrel domain-containing protein [Candidatus Sodalis endolongispinus]|uniref:Autotransporter outer membrane beta-barrel domain-containing protein n=1 Tax=Candidatus Sodalis endolongispinus TaxID=2812662 RepID=A0ABS5YDX7_9GAMM|nr:autotransporter outer membrane beta-barrel domain-containing protein [Candidatus Sodalis endolongispinus]